MITDHTQEPLAGFPQIVASAISALKERLAQRYQEAYPGLSELIHLVLDEEEVNASELSFFPHLILPDLVEAHIAKLGLALISAEGNGAPIPDPSAEQAIYQPALALCG